MAPLINLRWQTNNIGKGASGDTPKETDPLEKMQELDKELRELVKQDVDRTMQDNDFFTKDEVKDELSNILYLWSKDNVEFGYRQGMNEVLAILVMAFFSETIADDDEAEANEKMKVLSDQEIINLNDDEML